MINFTEAAANGALIWATILGMMFIYLFITEL